MPDGLEHERSAVAKTFWKSAVAVFALATLTVISYIRLDWIQTALGSATLLAVAFTVMVAGEMWNIRRGRREL